MKVIARKGLRVPMESGMRRYVTDSAVVDVPNTVYYRRRIAEGDLIDDPKIVAAAEKAAPAPAPVQPEAAETNAAKEASPDDAGVKNAAKGV
ncbi:hypothetical protein NUV26_21245 [Burkholderia pseudomultivorans]|uniref:hypothetical protein n=1 Tax=Burkholderia pseudomultivorans TaxID=1207504 RepID=UPI002874B419|nr:hypothetical protein [Burkholderia pseudomultivorans]MDS0794698.1 hypothetical protein [Burkholderia pseudomultivorans]